MAKKPVLFPEDLEANPDARFDPEYWEGRAADPSWVHGYSEIVQANDIAQVDDLDFQNAMRDAGGKIKTKEDVYKLIGARPQQLPIELAWLPISGPNGENMSPDQRRQLDQYENRMGFRPATKDVLDEHGYTLSRSAYIGEDGMIRRGPDVGLYYRSGEVARKWKAHKQRRAAEYEGREILDERLQDGSYVAPTFSDQEDSVEDIAHK